MNDAELLALAAKAAGVDMSKEPSHQDECAYWRYEDLCTCGARWSPLTDDGDALRLAVKLGMHIHLNTHRQNDREDERATVFTFDAHGFSFPKWPAEEVCGTDPYAATRRAIVRAAASLAKDMP